MSETDFFLFLSVRAPATKTERYPETVVASIEVPVRPQTAWRIYQRAVADLMQPDVMSEEQYRELRRKWEEPIR